MLKEQRVLADVPSMKVHSWLRVVPMLALILAPPALACQFDTDCFPGSKCIKGGGIYGACVGGIQPGNRNDKVPVYNPLDPNRTYGDTCQFDTDCGPSSKCAKGGGIYGTCLR